MTSPHLLKIKKEYSFGDTPDPNIGWKISLLPIPSGVNEFGTKYNNSSFSKTYLIAVSLHPKSDIAIKITSCLP